jgi:hypothetical protein
MKANLARLTMALAVLSSMALTAGAGIKWGQLAALIDDLGNALGF